MSDIVRTVMADKGVHRWVKEQFLASLNRDPVDALHDAKLLAAMLQDRWDQIKIKISLEQGGLKT